MEYKKPQDTFLLFTIAILALITCCSEPNSNRQAAEYTMASQNDIPKLSLTTTEGEKTTITENYKGKTILVLFQPDCEDCRREVAQIKGDIAAFEEYVLYFVSDADLNQIASFAMQYQLNDIENIIFAQITVQDVISKLGQVPAPSIYIYSAEGKPVKSFNGEVGIDQIKAFL